MTTNTTRTPRTKAARARTRRGAARALPDHVVRRWEPTRALLQRLPRANLYAEALKAVRDLTPLLPAEHDAGGEFLDILARCTAMAAVFQVNGTPEHKLSSGHPALLALGTIAATQALRAERRVGIQTSLDFMHDPRPAPTEGPSR